MNTNSYVIISILVVGFMPLAYYLSKIAAESIIARAKVDRKFKNEVASITYMIISFAPPICSFSVVSAVTASEDKTTFGLITIFVIGLVINHYGRKLRDELFKRTRNEIPGFKQSDYLSVMRGENK